LPFPGGNKKGKKMKITAAVNGNKTRVRVRGSEGGQGVPRARKTKLGADLPVLALAAAIPLAILTAFFPFPTDGGTPFPFPQAERAAMLVYATSGGGIDLETTGSGIDLETTGGGIDPADAEAAANVDAFVTAGAIEGALWEDDDGLTLTDASMDGTACGTRENRRLRAIPCPCTRAGKVAKSAISSAIQRRTLTAGTGSKTSRRAATCLALKAPRSARSDT
jgi:hypothetical protein